MRGFFSSFTSKHKMHDLGAGKSMKLPTWRAQWPLYSLNRCQNTRVPDISDWMHRLNLLPYWLTLSTERMCALARKQGKKARHGKGYERGINEIGLAVLFKHSLYKPSPSSVSKYVTPETYRSLA